MNCKSIPYRTFPTAAAILAAAFLSLSCNESLPVYVPPQNIMTFKYSLIEQLNEHDAPPGHQAVRLLLVGENVYDEVFYGPVNIHGSIDIVWERKPGRRRTIELTEKNLTDRSLVHDGKMMLLPGQKFVLSTVWNLRSDDSLYLPDEMIFINYRRRVCGSGIHCSDPEVFLLNASVNIYDNIGVLDAPPEEFTFTGWSL